MLETIERMARLTSASARRRSPTPAGRATSTAATSTCARPSTWRATRGGSSPPASRLVGGCCGTTPEHIRQIKAVVRAHGAGRRAARHRRVTVGTGRRRAAPVDRREKSALARALADGRFAVVVEVAAPRGLDLAAAVAQARRFRELGAIAVNVPGLSEVRRARERPGAGRPDRAAGAVETLLHYSCRDRNLIGMQSDLVGAHAMGVRNVLLTTGNPAPQGTYADATSVFDVDAIGLTNVVARLNHGLDIAGQPIGAPTRFHIGVAVEPVRARPRRGVAPAGLQGGGRRRVHS